MADLQVRVIISAVTDSVRAGFGVVRSEVTALSQSIQSNVSSAVSSGLSQVSAVSGSISSALSTASSGISTATSHAISGVSSSAGGAVSALGSVVSSVSSGASSAIGAVSSAATRSMSVVSSSAASMRSTLNDSFGSMRGIFAGLGLVSLAKDILDTNREMESLRVQLVSVTGSVEKGSKAFGDMLELAAATPLEIKDLSKSYIMLKNFGLEPTKEVMHSLTEQVSKLGGKAETLDGITLALGQAWGKGKLQAQEINQMVERGVPVYDLLTKATGKQSAELLKMSENGEITRDVIEKLIAKMGEMAEGSSARAMDTLNGKISVLSDSWHKFEDTLLQDKSEGAIKSIVGNWSEWLDVFSEKLDDAGGNFAKLEEINRQIVSKRNVIKFFETDPVKATALAVATGTYKGEEENALKALLIEREKLLLTIKAQRDEEKATADLEAKKLQDAKALAKQQADMAEHAKKLADWSEKYASNAQKLASELAKAKKELGSDFTPAIEQAITAKFSKSSGTDNNSGGGGYFRDDLVKYGKQHNYDGEKLYAHVIAEALKNSVDPDLILAMVKNESHFNPSAISKDKQGNPIAYGISQFTPPTAHDYKLKDPLDPFQSITAHAKKLSDLMKQANGDAALAVAGYNTGWGNIVGTGKNKHEPRIPQNGETPEYVKRVLGDYDKAKQENGSSGRDKGLLDQYSSELDALKAKTEAKFITAESGISLSVVQAEHDAKQTIDSLSRLKAEGKIGANDYYAALTTAQESAIKANIAAIQQKLAIAEQQFNNDKQAAKPEDAPKIEADYQANKNKLLQQEQQFNDEILAIYQANNAALAAENSQFRQQDIDHDEAYSLARLADAEDEVRQLAELGQISHAELLAKQQEFEERRYAIVQDAIVKRRSLLGSEDKEGQGASFRKEEAEYKAHAKKLQTINHQVALDSQRQFKEAFEPLKSSFSGVVQGILQGTTTLRKGLRSILQSIVLSYADSLAKMAVDQAAHWAWELLGFGQKETAKTAIKATSEATQTGSAAIGAVTRGGIEMAAAAQSKAITLTTTISKIHAHAAESAAGAYAAIASIPYVGPVLAPIAAAAAYVGTMAFGAISSSAGGEWNVPEDRLNFVHKNETILPAHIAKPLREMVERNATGGAFNVPQSTFNAGLNGVKSGAVLGSADILERLIAVQGQQKSRPTGGGKVVLNTQGGDFIHKNDVVGFLNKERRRFAVTK